MKHLKKISFLFLAISLNSCILLFPTKNNLIDRTDKQISTGVQITINELARPLGSNKTNIELYEFPKNRLIKTDQYNWNSIHNIALKNGVYKLITYYHYVGKDRLKTETIIKVNNNMVDIEIEYPLFVTSKAKLKMNGIKIGNTNVDTP